MKKSIIKTAAVLSLGTILLMGSLGFKSDFFEIAKQLEIFTTLFKELNMNYVDQTNPGNLMDTAINAMLKDLDPYTHYWNEQEVQAAKINHSAQYTGIGATVEIRDNKIIIVEPYKGYPADKAGLKAGDEILKIGEIVVANFKEGAGALLKGAPNSDIQITYKRQNKLKSTVITLGAIEIKAVPYYKLLNNGIGYIVLSQFSRHASEETIAAIKDLKTQGANKIILDLRGNPGGLLSEAINISNIFLPKDQLITSTKSVVKKYNKTYYTTRDPVAPNIPVAVLINGRSASASEIVAGALQDLDRAVIIGSRSFGKGLVQRPVELSYGTQLKVTIARYFTPSGRCIQALNYRNRDEEGHALRIKKSDYNEFTTKNGRKVYDGGGILPDIQMQTSKYSGITKELLFKNAIFDFATQYYYSHSLNKLEDFKFGTTDYSNFKKFLKTSGFEYITQTEKKLKEILETAKKEGLEEEITPTYHQMKDALETSKNNALTKKKDEIIRLLSDEIIKRYFYKEGLYNYYVQHNPEILKAKKILNSPEVYSGILK